MATTHIHEKFASIRKGLLEFLILKIVASDKVYVADILQRLSPTEFATQEGTLYPLLSKMRREGTVDYDWQESDAGPPRKYYKLTAKGQSQLDELREYWAHINRTLDSLGRGLTCTK
jgi:PadR family transcriptional regulator PadR